MTNAGIDYMKSKYLLSTIIAVLFITAGFGHIVFGQNTKVTAKAESLAGDRFTVSAKTPKGATIYAVNKPTSTVLNAIDKGLTDLFAVAKKNGYRTRLNYTDYTIYIAKADRTKNAAGEYSPDFAVGAQQYAGSVYDQGGFIYAAGMVLAYTPCSFIIAEHEKKFERISDVVRFEGEHIVLYHNDRRRYNETADHSKGGGHPILQ